MAKRLLNYVQIEYAASPAQPEGIPWVVVAVDPESPNDRIVIHQIEGCRRWIEAHDREYLDAILLDWKMTLNRDGAALLDSLSELAIGPLRTAVSGACAKDELGELARALAEKTREGPPPQIT